MRAKLLECGCNMHARRYFVKALDAGDKRAALPIAARAAIAYTILGSCRLSGVDPLEYLRDVLPLMTRKIRLIDLSDLLPHRWKQRRDAVAAFCAGLARLGRGGD